MLSFLTTPLHSQQQTRIREAYRMRLEEIAGHVSGSVASSDEAPAMEPVPPLAPTQPLPPEEDNSGMGAGPIAGDDITGDGTAEMLAACAANIARELTESWSGVLTGLDRRAALDRNQLQTGLAMLDSISGNLQAFRSRLDDLSEEARTAHVDYQDAISRLRDGEQRLTSSESRLDQVDEGLCWALASQEEIRSKLEAEEAATASLGQAVRNQTELIEAQVMPNLARLNERLESIAQTLQTHSNILDRLGAAWSSTQAAQQSLQGGLDRQAEVIDAVRLTTKAQVEMWGQLLKAATDFTQTREAPAGGITHSVQPGETIPPQTDRGSILPVAATHPRL
jgi:hypothetical protein